MFWVPLAYAVAGSAVGMLLPRAEAYLLPNSTLGVSLGSAQLILSTIASGMMALTAIVFSVAFVMVQFSATAYSPRLVIWLARSAVINHSIGVFTATFLYAIGAIAWIDRRGLGMVPPITVWFAGVLLFVSVLFFVLLVEKIGMLQVTRVLMFAGDEGRRVINRMYPPPGDPRQGGAPSPAGAALPARAPVLATLTHRGGPGVVQAVRTDPLVALARRHDVVIALAVSVGDTVMDGMTILTVHGNGAPPPEARIRQAVELGPERTFEQDPKYALRILVDVAIKALSPAINDPTTAVQALDQIEDLLLRLGRCDLDVGRAYDAEGRLRFVMPVPTWNDLVVLALDEIRFCGATSVQVMRRTRALLEDLRAQVRSDRRADLEYFLARVDKGIRRDFQDADDQRDALEHDRQGLGLSRNRREEAAPDA
ncbi:MAG: DUF2254 domain-containing protein [Acidobacteria bacterium]|nr:DUF2254 domain-containing protein [Acidobacteriota bacterium]